jgi:hypothetical protein
MENPTSKPDNSEESLIKLYREVSGASEMSARSVLIHLDNVISEKLNAGGKASPAGESGPGPAR